MADTLSKDLKNIVAEKASWTTPCTFKRMYRMPIDAKSCFETYDELVAYIEDAQTTAYPGMYVAVTSCEDPQAGAYIIMSDGSSLHPIKINGADGTVKSVTVTGGNNPEGESFTAYPDENGDAKIVIDGLEFDEMWVNKLFLGGIDITTLFPDLSPINAVEPIDKEKGFTLEDVADKFNELLAAMKSSAAQGS